MCERAQPSRRALLSFSNTLELPGDTFKILCPGHIQISAVRRRQSFFSTAPTPKCNIQPRVRICPRARQLNLWSKDLQDWLVRNTESQVLIPDQLRQNLLYQDNLEEWGNGFF